jgi:hypothetical protein
MEILDHRVLQVFKVLQATAVRAAWAALVFLAVLAPQV